MRDGGYLPSLLVFLQKTALKKKRERMDARVTVKENGDFRRIYRRGRSAVSGGVVVYCLKNRKGMSQIGRAHV